MEPVEEVLDEGSLDRLYNLTVGFWEPRGLHKSNGKVGAMCIPLQWNLNRPLINGHSLYLYPYHEYT